MFEEEKQDLLVIASGKNVDLSRRRISDRVLNIISTTLRSPTEGGGWITRLVLERTQLTIRHARILADGLKDNSTLLHLDVSKNRLFSNGIKFIAQALKNNKTLRSLHLDDTHFGGLGMKYIADMLFTNRSLRHLNVGNSKVEDAGCRMLSYALTVNDRLTSLRTTGNLFTLHGCHHLISSLEISNVSLMHIVLYHENEILYYSASQEVRRLQSIARRNSSIFDGVRSVIYYIIGIRKQKDKAGMGVLGVLPKELVLQIIVPYIWSTRGDCEWSSILKQIK